MSLEVLLLPLGIAAIAAVREMRSSDLCEKCRATRIKDSSLLLASLGHLGATAPQVAEDRVVASSRWGPLTFQRVGELFLGRVDGREDLTENMLGELHSAMGVIVQAAMVEDLRHQAEQMGMLLLSETDQNGTVQLVFEEAR